MALDEARSLEERSIQQYLESLRPKNIIKPIFEEGEEKIKEREIDLEGSFQQLKLNEKIF